uniref:Uncharacterized protein n=1 Tax=Pithovirus LCPAC201 TaxID=2506591 RepID=A0A481Z786_9VIRU|nr:MAG: hypothetical protein LCPAC201_03000 [Pithovirus LCPAC201]
MIGDMISMRGAQKSVIGKIIFDPRTPSGLIYNPEGTVYHRVVVPLLRRYQQASFIGTTGDLYTLLSRETPKYNLPPELPEWDNSKPTLPPNPSLIISYGSSRGVGLIGAKSTSLSSQNLSHSEKLERIKKITIQKFEAELKKFEWFDRITEFVKETPGLIMAGGYVVKSYLSQLGYYYDGGRCQDIDLFLTGPAASSPEAAKKVVSNLERIFIEYCHSHQQPDGRTPNKFSMARTSNCINFFYCGVDRNDRDCGYIGQVILRLYDHPSEVLHGFDLGSCQMAYDGEEVFTTSAGLLAIMMGINVIDMKRRRRTYEKRLSKYFGRGFGIVFPNFSPASLELQIIRTPDFMMFKDPENDTGYPRCSFKPLTKGSVLDGEEYSGMLESYQVQVNDYKVERHNISNYIRQKSYGSKPYYLIRLSCDDRDSKSVSISDDSVKIYFTCGHRSYESYYSYYTGVIKGAHDGSLQKLGLQEMKNRFTSQIVKQIIDLAVNTEQHLQYDLETKIQKEIVKFVKEIRIELPKITIPIEWRSPGDGNDLNATFGMDRVPIEKWYGEHYFPLGWDETKFKYYSQEIRDSIRTIMFVRNRETSYIRFLPMELMFYIFGYLVPR